VTGTIGSTAAIVFEACEQAVPADALAWVHGLDSQRDPLELVRVLTFFGIPSVRPDLPLVKRSDWPAVRSRVCEHFDEFWLVPADIHFPLVRAFPARA
jgi:hypothetical protein